jgi:hypothetical protein
MVHWLLLVLALCAPTLAASQGSGILELPTVTVVGADTLFLQAPPPREAQLPPGPALEPRRLAAPDPRRPRLPGEPSPAATALEEVQGARRGGGPVRTAAGTAADGPLAEAGAASPQLLDPLPLSVGSPGTRSSSLLAFYVPTEALRGGLRAVRALGPWELGADLDVALADGWLSLPPAVPNVLLGRLEGRRDPAAAGGYAPGAAGGNPGAGNGGGLGLSVSGSAGAFQPPGAELAYFLGLGETLALPMGRVLLIHATDAAGLSAEGAGRIGLLGQHLSINAYPGRFLLHAGGGVYMRGRLEPEGGGVDALVRLGAGYRSADGTFALAAGGSGLYQDGAVRLYPEAGLSLSPWEWVRFQLGATAFLAGASRGENAAAGWGAVMPWPLVGPDPSTLAAAGGPLGPIPPMGILADAAAPELAGGYALAAQAVAVPGSVPLLETQRGYAVRSSLVLALASRLRARLAAEYVQGTLYEGRDGALAYEQVSRIMVLAEASVWLLRFQDGATGLEAVLRGLASLPIPAEKGLLEDLYAQRLEGELRLAFPKIPVRIIMGALWGEVPAGVSAVTQPAPWQPFTGVAAELSAEYRFARRHAVRAGCEVRWADAGGTPELRFVAGYRYQ